MPINSNIFLHESDKAALEALKAIPGFTALMKAYMKAFNEKIFYLQNMSSNIRISDRQLKKYKDMLIPICDKLGIDVPDLFLQLSPIPNSYTSGDSKPFIVMTSGLLESLPERLIPTVLAHECGHIACHHVLYRTMGQMILNGAIFALLGASPAVLITQPIKAAFYYWMRCSEFSADRAAVLCDGTSENMVEVCARLAGFSKNIPDDIDIDAFVDQAKEYKQMVEENALNKTMEFMTFGFNTHPLSVIRAQEAREWTSTDNFIKAKEYFASYRSGNVPEEIPVPGNEKAFVNRDVNEVVRIFEDAGFTVETSRSIDRNVLMKSGNVTAVLINGTQRYREGEWVKADAKVEVRYYKPLTAEEEEALHPGEVKLKENLSSLIGKDYQEVENILFGMGIVNTTLVRVDDVRKISDKELNKVISIETANKDRLRKGDWLPVLGEVFIKYHGLANNII